MSEDSLQPLRQDVQNFVSACEHLLASTSLPDSPPLSQDERQLIDAYTLEVRALVFGPHPPSS